MKRLRWQRHLTAEQARGRYLSCGHPVEKSRWHAVWLLLRADEPRSPAQVAGVLGLAAVTVRDYLHRWNEHGPGGLLDRRKANGAKPLLDERQGPSCTRPSRPPPDGGLWTGPKVARSPRAAGASRCARRPAGSGCASWASLQVPRPSHPRAAGAEQRRRWEKT